MSSVRSSPSSIVFIMVQLKFLTVTLAAIIVACQAGPCNVCNPVNVIQDGNFEGSSNSWTLDSGVTIVHNGPGGNYASLDVSQLGDIVQYGISQQLSGVIPNQPYWLRYNYGLSDESGLYDGGVVKMVVSLDGVQIGAANIGIRVPYQYIHVDSTVTPTTANPVLSFVCSGNGDNYGGATVIISSIGMQRECFSN
ncbi:hypothetical protein BGZ63DRAFT_395009 [Mariannaea sp. PMI_226]|nr:hypothetical protein BGZ63DRAFT_395009 [Mariannaea sp. PMI_226]